MQTYNAYGPAYAPDLAQRSELLLEWIENEPCEVMQFQEVWGESHFEQLSGALQSWGYLARFPQAELRHGDSETKVGLASFTRSPHLPEVEALYFYDINNHDGVLDDVREVFGVGKGIHWQTANVANAGKFEIFNTHTHPLNQGIRVAQIAELIQFAWGSPAENPLLLTGDLNATPDSLELRLLRDVLLLQDSFAAANQGYRESDCTLCKENPRGFHSDDRVVDYVLFRPGRAVRLIPVESRVNWRAVEGTYLSDHFGVRTQFAVGETKEAPVTAPERLERLERALRTLEEARAFLVGRKKNYFRTAIQRLEHISDTLKAAREDSAALPYFLY